MRRILTLFVVLVAVTAALAGPKVGRGLLYYDGSVVRTIVPPAAMTKPGTDDLYVVTNGVTGQFAVAAVAPGDRDYHGGKWAFHAVTWITDPYLLTSSTQVLAAEAAGHLTITRVPENDFKCPIQPSKDGGFAPE